MPFIYSSSDPQTQDVLDDVPGPSVSTTLTVPTSTQSLPTLSDLAVVSSPASLSDEQKYQILTNVGSKLNKYPTNSQKRRFQPHWCELFPWIRYSVSESVDGVFCAPCFLFSKARLNSE